MNLLIALLVGSAAFSLAAASDNKGQAPEAGDVAPTFSLQGSDGKSYDLAEFKGKKAVVVAWFPKAFTGG